MARIVRLPDREQIIKQMWKLANAGAGDAVKLACFPPEEWRGTEKVELKFVDRGRLLERLLDTVDHSGEDQVDRFLQAMEGEG